MRKTKLPTSYKGGTKCHLCKALLIHKYDYYNSLYLWYCQNCGATRYDHAARFEARFQQASEIGK